jgi:pyruvate dehydrogenase E1 component alpha subunit
MDSVDAEIKAEIEAAVDFAKQSPYPAADEATTDVYTTDNERGVAR